jgi:hypothetical protein
VTNRSKQRGTSWESAVVAYLQQCGWPHAERRVLHGSQDKGDVLGVPGLVIECKSAARIELAQWVTETRPRSRTLVPSSVSFGQSVRAARPPLTVT